MARCGQDSMSLIRKDIPGFDRRFLLGLALVIPNTPNVV
jgi:hypothetical protein